MKKIALITAIAAAGTISMAAQADTTTFEVSAEVVASCDVTATNITLIDVNPTVGVDGDATNNGTVDVTCTNGTAYSVLLDYGVLTHGTDALQTLDYSLFSDVALATVWTAAPGEVVTGNGDGLLQPHDVFIQVNARADALVGTYTDIVNVSIDF